MAFGTCKLSEMAFATASSVVPEGPAGGETRSAVGGKCTGGCRESEENAA